MRSLANSEDPDEMPHYVAIHLGLCCLFDKNLLQGMQYILIWKI